MVIYIFLVILCRTRFHRRYAAPLYLAAPIESRVKSIMTVRYCDSAPLVLWGWDDR